jgi:hypothetical protein
MTATGCSFCSQDVSKLMYPETELRTMHRKAFQIHFLQQRVVDIKSAFNLELEKMVKQKHADADKVCF